MHFSGGKLQGPILALEVGEINSRTNAFLAGEKAHHIRIQSLCLNN
ncbi:hypothetical protein NSE_0174 [Neorickettsia sennetsu str. Miyayama]|uniref:Uncharacterized protein n=1 Tax=Ehrlichia sennetsu (strain ATCC VR-367 / Miyayama) TaxID=222891 RepID=Q2GEM7_EHRS3|nr:hypothetical protein NSE_0174 [Neorickettsia sennetsu str. Miyayama]